MADKYPTYAPQYVMITGATGGFGSIFARRFVKTVIWAAYLPEHVNINTLEVMPTKQSFSALSVERHE